MEKKICDIAVTGPSCRNRYLNLVGQSCKNTLLRENGIPYSGLGINRFPYEWGRIDPPLHTFIFTIGGAGVIRGAQNRFIARHGDLAILPAHQPHDYTIFKEPWEIFWLHCESSKWPLLAENQIAVRKSLFWEDIQGLLVCYHNEQYRDDSLQRDETLRRVSELILFYLGRELKGHRYSPQDIELRRKFVDFIQRIESSPGQSWTLSKLASDFCMSPRGLTDVTHKLVGLPPMEWVVKLRMQRAADLLLSTGGKLSSIAGSVGYKNPYAFSTAFKRFHGLSPRAYRTKMTDVYAGKLKNQE